MIPPRCAARGPGAWLAAGALLLACAAPRAAPPPAAPVRFEPARIARDLAWLADDAREGRGVGTPGVAAAAAYLAEGFREAGLSPGGDDGSFIQRFEMPVEIRVSKASLSLGAAPLARGADFEPFLSSGDGAASGEPVFAGYGISAPELGYDDYDETRRRPAASCWCSTTDPRARRAPCADPRPPSCCAAPSRSRARVRAAPSPC